MSEFLAAGINHSAVIPQSLAGRIIFQVDQTTPQDQEIFWNIRECCENPSLDSRLRLRACRDTKKTSSPPRKPLHNFTNPQRLSLRKNIALSANYRTKLHGARWEKL